MDIFKKETNNYNAKSQVKSYSLRSDSDPKRINYKDFLNFRLNGNLRETKTCNFDDNDIIVIGSSSDESDSDTQLNTINKNAKNLELKSDNEKTNELNNSNNENSISDDDNFSWISENDKNKWCICQKPWDKRFMIMCDDCLDWYHGECVNISKEEGKCLEINGEKYVCPFCRTQKKKDNDGNIHKLKQGKNLKSKNASQELEYTAKVRKEKLKPEKDTEINQVSLNSSINTKEVDRQTILTISTKKRISSELSCLNLNCKRIRNIGENNSFFCSETCIKSYITLFLNNVKPNQKIKFFDTSTKSVKLFKPLDNDKDIESKLYKIFLKKPYYQFHVEKHNLKESSINNIMKGFLLANNTPEHIKNEKEEHLKKDTEKKLKHEKTQYKRKSVVISEDNKVNMELRETAKNFLFDAFKIRLDDSLIDCSKEKIQEIVRNVEQEMFNAYGENYSNKYKAKHRTLCFNIKDRRNNFFYKRIISGEISPMSLVTMTSEEMASEELVKWRQKETREELDAIERAQVEASKDINIKRIKITHKGEIFVKDEDMSDLRDNFVPNVQKSNEEKLDHDNEKSKNEEISCETFKNKLDDDATKDSTVDHNNHLFDIYCKICTGLISPIENQNGNETHNNFHQETLEKEKQCIKISNENTLKDTEILSNKLFNKNVSNLSETKNEKCLKNITTLENKSSRTSNILKYLIDFSDSIASINSLYNEREPLENILWLITQLNSTEQLELSSNLKKTINMPKKETDKNMFNSNFDLLDDLHNSSQNELIELEEENIQPSRCNEIKSYEIESNIPKNEASDNFSKKLLFLTDYEKSFSWSNELKYDFPDLLKWHEANKREINFENKRWKLERKSFSNNSAYP